MPTGAQQLADLPSRGLGPSMEGERGSSCGRVVKSGFILFGVRWAIRRGGGSRALKRRWAQARKRRRKCGKGIGLGCVDGDRPGLVGSGESKKNGGLGIRDIFARTCVGIKGGSWFLYILRFR